MFRRALIASGLAAVAGATYALGRWLFTVDEAELFDQSDEDAWLRGDTIPRPVKQPGDGCLRASGRAVSAGPRAIP